MYPCKHHYSYEELVENYITYNINTNTNIVYNEGKPLDTQYLSTAKGRLSFNKEYLISYETEVAKFVHTKKATYLLIDSSYYSSTTSKHLNILFKMLPSPIISIYTTDIENSFTDIVKYYMDYIHLNYEKCKTARKGSKLRAAIEINKSTIQSILPELHSSTRKATLRKLQELPNIPRRD